MLACFTCKIALRSRCASHKINKQGKAASECSPFPEQRPNLCVGLDEKLRITMWVMISALF